MKPIKLMDLIKESEENQIYNQYIINPVTKSKIKVSTALSYGAKHPAYQIAKNITNKAFGNKIDGLKKSGKIKSIATTSSGKPIYNSEKYVKHLYSDYTPDEHKEIAKLFNDESKYRLSGGPFANQQYNDKFNRLSALHNSEAKLKSGEIEKPIRTKPTKKMDHEKISDIISKTAPFIKNLKFDKKQYYAPTGGTIFYYNFDSVKDFWEDKSKHNNKELNKTLTQNLQKINPDIDDAMILSNGSFTITKKSNKQ